MTYTICTFPSFQRALRKHKEALKGELRHVPYLLLLLLPLGTLGWDLFSSRYLVENPHGGINSGGSVWADMPIHMTFANSFLYGANRGVWLLNMQSPIFAGAAMHYPFIPDYHMAVVIAGGSTMRNAAYITGALLFIAFCGLMYLLAQRLTKSPLVGVLAPLMVIGAAGMGGFSIVQHLGWRAAITRDPIQDLAHHNSIVWWFGFLTHVFLPQRGATWAYPLCLFVCLLGWEAASSERLPLAAAGSAAGSAPSKQRLLLLAATCAALSPLVQAHSFVFLAILFAVLFAFDALGSCRRGFAAAALKPWVVAGAVTAAISLPQIAMFQSQMENAPGHNGFLKLSPIFKTPWEFVERWWLGLGPTVFLFLGVLAWETVAFLRLQGPQPSASAAASQKKLKTEEAQAPVEAAVVGDSSSNTVRSRKGKAAATEKKPVSDAPQAAAAAAAAAATPSPAAVTLKTYRFAMFLAAALVFVTAFTIQFQPWDRDNIKLFYLVRPALPNRRPLHPLVPL